jgi:hypothetical protein
MHPGSIGMLLGGLITVVGSLLPWVTTPFGSLYGFSGAGLYTICCGFIAIAGALLPYRKVAIGHSLAAGGIIAILCLWQLGKLLDVAITSDTWGKALPGMGLVMVAGGAVILLRTGYRLVKMA